MNQPSTQSDKDTKPHQQPNDDQGSQKTYKHTQPEQKPHAEPEHPLKEQK